MQQQLKPMRDTLLESIYVAMKTDVDVFFVSADFGSPVLDKIRTDFPDRFLNVGIAEQSLINVSTGLALEGFKVFAYAIAPFITMRCYEQIRVNLALLSQLRAMNVTLIGVGAGYSYVVSGPTHQCYEDITIMRALPNISVYSPSDWNIASQLADVCLAKQGVRYLRLDAQVTEQIYLNNSTINFDKGFHEFSEGIQICIVSTGYMTQVAHKLIKKLQQDGIRVGHIDMINLSKFDETILTSKLSQYQDVISLEEAFIGKGGLDSIIRKLIDEFDLKSKFHPKGIEAHYQFELGDRNSHHERAGIGHDSLNKTIRQMLKSADQER